MALRDSHCSFCGAAFDAGASWPRRCDACGNTSYKNPLPVAVLVLEVSTAEGAGALLIRRNIPPAGRLALPGGFIDHGESWQHAAARELSEEAQVTLDPGAVRELCVVSAPDGTLLVFGTARYDAPSLPPFVANDEVSERLVVTRPVELAFAIHTQVLHDWFAGRRAPAGG